MRPTKKEIEEEIKKLKELAPVIRQTSLVGTNNKAQILVSTNNRAQIEAQIKVLENLWDNDEIYDHYDHAGIEEEILDAAIGTRQWLDGEHDVDTLSEDWEVLRQ